MIDNSCFIIQDFSNQEFENLTTRLNINCPINSNKLGFKHQNLMIKYYPNDNKLKISNSLHCFYNAELGIYKSAENYNDFTFWHFQVVIEYLTKILIERPQEDFILSTNLEVGLNIQLSHSPWEIMSRYLSYSTTSTNEFYSVTPYGLKGKPIERMCYLNDYKIKVYDKSKQSNLQNKNLLRYEIIYTQLRKIRSVLGFNPNSTLTLANLNDKATWDSFFRNLLNIYDDIKKIPMLENHLMEGDIFAIHEYCNKILSDDIQFTMNPNTFKKRKIKKKIIYEISNQNKENAHFQIRNQIVKKYKELIDIPEFPCL